MSDPQGILASPFTIIGRTDDSSDISAIIAIIDQNQVGVVVVGLPLSMKGSIGSQAEKVQIFGQKLSKSTKVPIEYRDERFTTMDARRIIKMNRKSPKTKDDAMAAALILQGYLDEGVA